jgi:hypothetical protein
MTTENTTWNNAEAALRSELTVEAFAAGLIGDSSGPCFQPFWLCTSDEAKQEVLGRFRALYDRWVDLELRAAKARFEIEQEALLGQSRDIN